MTKGSSNSYGVTVPQISFISRLLSVHTSVAEVVRTNDIQFDLMTSRGVGVRLICVNEYTCGLVKVLEVLEDFLGTHMIYVGGVWNGYTMAAKEYCIEAKLGLFNASEINGALYLDDYCLYDRSDGVGTPIYPTKAS